MCGYINNDYQVTSPLMESRSIEDEKGLLSYNVRNSNLRKVKIPFTLLPYIHRPSLYIIHTYNNLLLERSFDNKFSYILIQTNGLNMKVSCHITSHHPSILNC